VSRFWRRRVLADVPVALIAMTSGMLLVQSRLADAGAEPPGDFAPGATVVPMDTLAGAMEVAGIVERLSIETVADVLATFPVAASDVPTTERREREIMAYETIWSAWDRHFDAPPRPVSTRAYTPTTADFFRSMTPTAPQLVHLCRQYIAMHARPVTFCSGPNPHRRERLPRGRGVPQPARGATLFAPREPQLPAPPGGAFTFNRLMRHPDCFAQSGPVASPAKQRIWVARRAQPPAFVGATPGGAECGSSSRTTSGNWFSSCPE